MSYIKLQPSDFVISADSVTVPAWTGNTPGLVAPFYTSSYNTTAEFYADVYQVVPTTANAEPQFSIAYGHIYGSGSTYYNTLVPGVSPTKTVYGQYRTLVFGDENTNFTFGAATVSQDIYVISVERARYKEHLLPGSFNLNLGTLSLTDNSKTVTVNSYVDCGRVFDIVSGSYGTPSTTSPGGGITPGYTSAGSYGMFLPDVGLIILNPNALALGAPVGIAQTPTRTANTAAYNYRLLLNAITTFQLNSEETISSDYIFVRVGNQDFNYTTNPSMISGSGDFVYSNFVNNPQTYITTVGLYNDNNELLAVAKTSKPLVKDFTKEALFRVKLDW